MASGDKNSIHLFAGSAALPQGTALSESLRIVSCVLKIDIRTETITEASFTTLSPLTNSFMVEILVGYRLKEGIAPLIKEIRGRMHFTATNAFVKALQNAHLRYLDFKKENL